VAPVILAAIVFAIVIALAVRGHQKIHAPIASQSLVPHFTVKLGQVREAMPYRIISFHRGRADKNLIKLAAQLGFNGVQFQIEGPNVRGLEDFAKRDANEKLVDYCHSLGMKVTLWVHEFSDLPPPWLPEYLGIEAADNDKLFRALEERYENILKNIVPTIDGLVLTVVETQVRATDPDSMKRLVDLIAAKCKAHGKSLIIRTFVWYPDEFKNVMHAINRLPQETVIMSKIVPQDWQMRGINAPEIGDVGGRTQIVEFDVAGEYFLKSTTANCMVDLLKRQFDYAISKNARGICVRADRDDSNVLFEPNEVNLWTLALLAGGVTDKTEDIWRQWAEYRYGKEAAPHVIKALQGTADVVAELLSVGPFTHGDTRRFPPLPDDDDFLLMNWQNWRWDRSLLSMYFKIMNGDAEVIAEVTRQKAAAERDAEKDLANLEAAKPHLKAVEYDILRTKLLTNKMQLAARGPMVLATLHQHAMEDKWSEDDRRPHAEAIKAAIEKVKAVAASLGEKPVEVDHLGKRWRLNVPENMDREAFYRWAYDANLILEGKNPRVSQRPQRP
jgi:hypothetical protein